MNHVSLFSGIGGIDLAAEWAGFHTIAFCESDPYCQKILNLRWPGVPICEDVHDMGREWLDEHGIGAITLVSGGFPCQPFSVAGKRRGKEDDRYLWPEMLRVIQELKPRWVLGENVTGFIRMGLDEALSDLEGCGYETQAFVIPACAVDAPHLRERVFIVAHRNGERFDESGAILRGDAGGQTDHGITDGENGYVSAAHLGQDVAHAEQLQQHGGSNGVSRREREQAQVIRDARRRRGEEDGMPAAQSRLGGVADGFSRWMDEPGDIPRVAIGVKDRVNRLKALGNSVVPAQVYPILKAIAEIERLQNKEEEVIGDET